MSENHLHTFGAKTFNKAKMKASLPYPIYLKWKNAIRNEEDLDRETADAIAHAMKVWALENDATHYCHWFQPLSGRTAKKHESFMDRTDEMEPMIRFSGKELIKSEPDASSFPNGGMRSTFEARGYTYWDCTANSFIIDHVLYIPSIFVSYHGEKLDKRGPLLAAMNLVSVYGSQIANLFAKEEHTYRLRSKLGLEQEFFLVDLDHYKARTDLKTCGRTLIGARPPKGQELEDHYYGSIPSRVTAFYEELNEELSKLGVYAKTEHNEVAPGQFEVAVLFENTNVSIDNNQLVMNLLHEVAGRHHLACLLHEKPFARVNGSGKHNNYSLATNYGLNCFDPGDEPGKNLLFLVFLAAMIKATDRYAVLLRVASSGPSNDVRLGGQEAPPAIISMFLGQDLEEVLKSVVEEGYEAKVDLKKIKVNSLEDVPRDASDRNRTSPFAFTGNKFEFRMLGSSRSASDVNIVLNAALADVLQEFGERLLPFDGKKELEEEAYALVRETIREHGRILYSGDNYSTAWVEEAARRGLPNLPTYYDALIAAKDKDLIDLFLRHNIFDIRELEALYEIGLEEVASHHALEARALLAMIEKDILPAALQEIEDLASEIAGFSKKPQRLLRRKETLEEAVENLLDLEDQLEFGMNESEAEGDMEKKAQMLQREVVPLFDEIRAISDKIEETVRRENWALPTYEEMFESVLW